MIGRAQDASLTLQSGLPINGSYNETLHLYKRTEVEFRFVTEARHSTSIEIDVHHEIVNTDSLEVVPMYALPDVDPNKYAFELCNSLSRRKDKRVRNFSNFEDAKALQHALTGYRVNHVTESLSWSIDGSVGPKNFGTGSVQLWQYKPLPISTTGIPKFYWNQHPAAGAQGFFSSNIFTKTKITGKHEHPASSKPSRADESMLSRPQLPALILFSVQDEDYIALHLELDPSTVVDPGLCNCRKSTECCVAILRSENRYLRVRRSKGDLTAWNIAQFRAPRHPRFDKLEVLDQIRYFKFDFPCPEGKHTGYVSSKPSSDDGY